MDTFWWNVSKVCPSPHRAGAPPILYALLHRIDGRSSRTEREGAKRLTELYHGTDQRRRGGEGEIQGATSISLVIFSV